jgi:hypothetical protein
LAVGLSRPMDKPTTGQAFLVGPSKPRPVDHCLALNAHGTVKCGHRLTLNNYIYKITLSTGRTLFIAISIQNASWALLGDSQNNLFHDTKTACIPGQ